MSLTDTLNMSLMANMGYSKSSSSPSTINIPNGEVPAEDISFYIYNDVWNAAYSAWIPTNGTAKQAEFANFASLALTPQVGTWDIDLGAELWWGTSQFQDANNPALLIRQNTDSYALTFQARGLIQSVPVSFFADYANVKHTADSLYSANVKDKNALSFSTEVAVLPRVMMLSAGYRTADNGNISNSSDNAYLVGARYFYRENVQFRFGYMYLMDRISDKHNIVATLDLAL